MIKINESIFKAYDIRGIYPTQLDEDLAYKIGRAYGTFILKENPKAKNIVVGADMRLSSPQLKKELVNGLLDCGLNVIDVGLVSVPTFYFVVGFYGYDGGVQVSASHNPRDYNGFKMVRGKSLPISKDTGIIEIKNIILNNTYLPVKNKGEIIKKENVLQDLVKEQLKGIDIDSIKKFKIVIDAANAMGALDMEELFKYIPVDLVRVNFNLDGSFPSHEADPLKEENLELIKKEVVKHKADLGISPDGDADRYFIVDEKGNTVRQEILRGIMAQIELKENSSATVCYDIRPGRITKDMIEEAGGKAVVTRVGHSLIKETMIANDAVFGGESSGHYFYKRPYGTFEMPIIFVAKFLKFLSDKNLSVSETIRPHQKYFNSGEINFKVNDIKEIIAKTEKAYSNGNINKLDGLTIEFSDWWFNLRGSNTEPVIRLSLESKTAELTAEKVKEVSALLKE